MKLFILIDVLLEVLVVDDDVVLVDDVDVFTVVPVEACAEPLSAMASITEKFKVPNADIVVAPCAR